MKLAKLKELVDAAVAGKTIQYKSRADERWKDCNIEKLSFLYNDDRYRVKPDPKIAYVTLFDDGSISGTASKEDAKVFKSSSRAVKQYEFELDSGDE